MHHGGEVPCRHGVHVGQDQCLGQVMPVRFLVLLAHAGEGLDDGGDGLLYPIETARAISGNNYVLKHKRKIAENYLGGRITRPSHGPYLHAQNLMRGSNRRPPLVTR